MKDPRYFRITDYDTSILPNPVLRRLEDGARTQEQWLQTTGRSPGHPAWGILYHVALASLHPEAENIIIETGTNWGSSSIVLAQALKDSGRPGHLHTVELDAANYEMARSRIAEAGLGAFVTTYLGDSQKKLPEILRDVASVRIAYLDGAHEIDVVLDEFARVEKKLTPGGLVMMDNTYPIIESGETARVSEALRHIMEKFGGNLINLPFVSWYTPGLAIWQKHSLDIFDRLGV